MPASERHPQASAANPLIVTWQNLTCSRSIDTDPCGIASTAIRPPWTLLCRTASNADALLDISKPGHTTLNQEAGEVPRSFVGLLEHEVVAAVGENDELCRGKEVHQLPETDAARCWVERCHVVLIARE
jgi:hypothetical protein